MFCDGERGRTQVNIDGGARWELGVSKGKEWEAGLSGSRKGGFHWSSLSFSAIRAKSS